MKFALKSFNSLVLAGLLATVGAGAVMAQAPAPAAPASAAGGGYFSHHGDDHKMGHGDPAKMQAWMAKRQAELKARLNITASQESAWTAYTAAMKLPVHMGQRFTPEQRAEFAKLTTPERIDKMQALHSERTADMTAAMKQRGDAIKAFYAVLTPEQKKTFDAEFAKHGLREGRDGHKSDMQPKG